MVKCMKVDWSNEHRCMVGKEGKGKEVEMREQEKGGGVGMERRERWWRYKRRIERRVEKREDGVGLLRKKKRAGKRRGLKLVSEREMSTRKRKKKERSRRKIEALFA